MSCNALFATASSALLVASAASANLIVAADFSTYADGALVGQNGWQQYNTSSTSPITVSGGRVNWAGNGNTASNNQDAILAFASQITQPVTGTTVLNFDILLSVSSAGASPSYFAALNTTTGTATSGNFQNVRMVAQASGAGYVFGTRLNGQGGYPFGYGTQVLTFGQTYALRAEINLVAGNANDFINLYVGSDFSNLSLYGTAGYGTGTVSDISVGAMLLSQFSSSTAFESGVSISSMSVSLVPTPGALALLGVAGLVARGRRR
jgi:MYXO-CTERM domain-containing protein